MNFEKLIEMRNKGDTFSEYIGLKTTKIDFGYAEGKLVVRNEHYNPGGALHGGLLFTIADTIGGSAVLSHGYQIVTVSSHMDFLNAGINVSEVYAYAKQLKKGNKVHFVEVEIYDQYKTLLCKGMFTYYNLGIELKVE